MGVVHHRVAYIELGQILDERFNIANLFLFFASSCGDAGCKQFGLGDQIDTRFKPMEARVQSRSGNAHFFVTGLELLQVIKGWWVEATGAKKIKQAFASARALGQNQDTIACAANVRLKFGQRFFGAAHHREVGQCLCKGVVCTCIGTLSQCQLRMLVGAGVKLLSR